MDLEDGSDSVAVVALDPVPPVLGIVRVWYLHLSRYYLVGWLNDFKSRPGNNPAMPSSGYERSHGLALLQLAE